MIRKIPLIKYTRRLSLTLGRFKVVNTYDTTNNKGFGLKESKEYIERLQDKCLTLDQLTTETTILIDDVRNINADMICRNYWDGVDNLRAHGPFKTLYLDHDLASYDDSGKEWTGYDIACFLEEYPMYAPREIVCVSSNPVGRARLEQVVQNIYRRRNV